MIAQKGAAPFLAGLMKRTKQCSGLAGRTYPTWNLNETGARKGAV